MAQIQTAFNKFFFYTGLVAVIWFGSKFHSWATNPGTHPEAVRQVKLRTKADIIREQEAANSGTLIMGIVMVLCFAGGYFYLRSLRKPEPIRVVEPEKPKPVAIDLESENSLIQRYCIQHGEELSVMEIADLFKAFPDYQTLHLTMIEKYANDLNYHQLYMLQNVGKEIKNEALGHRLRNLSKFWTQSKKARARDKYETRRFYDMLVPPLSVETA